MVIFSKITMKKHNLSFLLLLLMQQTPCIYASEKAAYDMQLEELLNVQVTSATKKAQALSDTAAAIFVISHEDIQRSGVTNIPDALRMAPGLDVARIDANKWAVSARGFNGRFANKLLVLIDGRSIYTQAFTGVYWENQDVMLEDVDRIEVIRGPGAALWGANAVNGMINIITKHSADTQGGLLSAGGGNKESGFGSLRYGAQLGKDTTGRIYVKGFQRDNFEHLDGTNANDQWNKIQGGFRVDSFITPKDALTIIGDGYFSKINQNLLFASFDSPNYYETVDDSANTSGGNVISRLEHTFSPTSNYKLQFYYDVYHRNEIIDHELRQTVDIDFQHRFSFFDWHDIVWGLGYRNLDTQNSFGRPMVFTLIPANRNDHYFSAFVQDEMAIVDNTLWFTLGSKFEHNDYTGFEFQPTARVMWSPHQQHRAWAAVSRAVRTPSTDEASIRNTFQIMPPDSAQNQSPFPVGIATQGSSTFKAETLIAYELGYRLSLSKALSLDFTAFYNDYRSLRSLSLGDSSFHGSYVIQSLVFDNSNSGDTYGFEAASVWQMNEWLRWNLSYSYLNSQINETLFYREAVPPQQKFSLRAEVNPWQAVHFDLWLRYMDRINVPYALNDAGYQIASYLTMDLRLAWKPQQHWELSLTGQNLLDNRHLEYVQEVYTKPTEVPRGIYGKISWQF